MEKIIKEQINRIQQLMNLNEGTNFDFIKRRISSDEINETYSTAIKLAKKKFVKWKYNHSGGFDRFRSFVISIVFEVLMEKLYNLGLTDSDLVWDTLVDFYNEDMLQTYLELRKEMNKEN